MKTACVAVVGLLLAVRPGFAQDKPATIPTRDVDVTYRMVQAPDAPALEQRMRWLVAEQKLRVDLPSPGLWMLVDYRSRRMQVVQDAKRRVLDMAGGTSPLPAQPGASGQSFTRRGTSQVAGLPCTEWQTADSAGQSTLACITTDGVLLRARQNVEGKWQTLIEASKVTYGPQDAAAFLAPNGYQHVQAPNPNQARPPR